MTRPLSTTYVAVHQRIAARRGKAREYQCSASGCEAQARTWAWQHTGPYIEAEPTPNNAARIWGTEIEDYAPMCGTHAMRLDLGGTLTHCPSGHERSDSNVYAYPKGSIVCLTCKTNSNRARKALRIFKRCEQCGLKVLEQNVAQHVKTVHHRSPRKIDCGHCGRRMHRSNKARHLRLVHSIQAAGVTDG